MPDAGSVLSTSTYSYITAAPFRSAKIPSATHTSHGEVVKGKTLSINIGLGILRADMSFPAVEQGVVIHVSIRDGWADSPGSTIAKTIL